MVSSSRSRKCLYSEKQSSAGAKRSKTTRSLSFQIYDEQSISSSNTHQNRADRSAGQPVEVQNMDHQNICDNKENCQNHCSSNASLGSTSRQIATLGEAKKIDISQDEKSMNGAPTGDLFDLSVHPDEELTSFVDDDDALAQLRLVSSMSCKLWVEKYERVQIIRRICLHHADAILNNNIAVLSQVLTYVIDEAESLRSCNVRNAVLCLKSMIVHCGQLLSSNHENCCSVVSVLLFRSANSPRFLMNLAFSSLSTAVTALEPSTLIDCLVSFSTHKNNEIAANAITIAVDCINHHYQNLILGGSDSEKGIAIRILFAGINSKRIKAKEGSKALLRRLLDSFGADSFLTLIERSLSPTQCVDLTRCMSLHLPTTQQAAGCPTSEPTASGPQRPRAVFRSSSRGPSSKATPSVGEHVLHMKKVKNLLHESASHDSAPQQPSALCLL